MTGVWSNIAQSSESKERIQHSLAAVAATDLYSTSVEDLTIVLLFLGAPRNEIVAKINKVSTGGRVVIFVTCPVSIREGVK